MIRGVAFDMDGLMFDTEQMGLDAWAYLGQLHGFHMPRALWLSVFGMRWPDIQRTIQANLGQDFPFDQYWEELKAYVDQRIAQFGTPIKPGLLELLTFLEKHGYQFTVASSTPRSRVEQYMKGAGVLHRFGPIVCGDMVEHGKPAPDIYLQAAQVMGLPPQECIALEDAPRGICSAYLAGMHPVFIKDLLDLDAQTEPMVSAIVPSLYGVIDLLQADTLHCDSAEM